MRRSRKSFHVAPVPTEVTENIQPKKEPSSNCPRDRSPISPQIRGVASTPIAQKSRESPPLFDESPLRASLSPIPFHCTQDGSRGENCVIWDYDSPSSKKSIAKVADPPLRLRNERVCIDYSPVSRISSKKKQLRLHLVQKNFLDAMNDELAALKQVQQSSNSKTNSKSDESNDNVNANEFTLLNDEESKALENAVQNNIVKLKDAVQLLSNDNANKVALGWDDLLSDSDNYMNELLIEASQKVEEKLQAEQKLINYNENKNIDNVHQTKSNVENVISNDTLDNLLMDINDSLIDGNKMINSNVESVDSFQMKNITNISNIFNNNRNTTVVKNTGINNTVKTNICQSEDSFQMKNLTNISKNFYNNETIVTNRISSGSFSFNNNSLNDSKSKLSRHSSMPTSYAKVDLGNKSNGCLSLSRHNSMPSQNEYENNGSQTLSICSAEEIKRKHEAAKEKLLSRKNVVRSNSDKSPSVLLKDININSPRLSKSFKENKKNSSLIKNVLNESILSKKNGGNCIKIVNIQEEIERKRKEALERLQRKRSRNLT